MSYPNSRFTVKELNAKTLFIDGMRINSLSLASLLVQDSAYNVGLNTHTPVVKLDISSNSGIKIPFGTTNEFKSLNIDDDKSKGIMRFNTDTSCFEAWNTISNNLEPFGGSKINIIHNGADNESNILLNCSKTPFIKSDGNVIEFRLNNNKMAQIRTMNVTGNTAEGSLLFYTANDSQSNYIERQRITDDGKFIFNNDLPSNTDYLSHFSFDFRAETQNLFKIKDANNNDIFKITKPTSNTFAVDISNVTQLHETGIDVSDNIQLNSLGRLSLGHKTPLHLLDIKKDTVNAIYDIDSSICKLGTKTNNSLEFIVNNTTLLTLKNNNVGIGTNNPTSKLHINKGDILITEGNYQNANKYIYTRWEDTANTHQIGLEFNYYTGTGSETSTHSRINFVSNAKNNQDITEAGKLTTMSILSNGNVGIGTDNPVTRLQIGNLDDFQPGIMTINNLWDLNALTIIHQTPTTATILNDPKPVLYLGRDGTAAQAYGALATFCISRWENAGTSYVGARTRMDIKLDHDMTGSNTPTVMTMRSDGNVGIGTDSPSALLHLRQNTTQDTTTNTDSQVNIMRFNVNSGSYTNPTYTYGIRLVQLNTPNIGTQLTYYGNSTGNNYDNKILTMVSNGHVGIGMIDPEYPLEIESSVLGKDTDDSGDAVHTFWFDSAPRVDNPTMSTSLSNSSYNHKIGLRCKEGIWAENVFAVSSDRRIKENIVDVPDNLSLQILRDISCCYYEYRDKINRGYDKTIGFIAQQVREHLPIAVDLRKNIIPNIMKKIEEPVWTDISTNEYKLTIPDLQDPSGNKKYRFYVSNNDLSGNSDTSGNKTISREEKKELFSLKDEPKSFIFDKKWENVFLYGEQVNDFHTIDKQKLFTVNFSATQEIDRIQQKHAMEIENLKNENAELKQQLLSIQQQLNQLLSQ